jgi:hypothetical protein
MGARPSRLPPEADTEVPLFGSYGLDFQQPFLVKDAGNDDGPESRRAHGRSAFPEFGHI